jgi:hypothetical protein
MKKSILSIAAGILFLAVQAQQPTFKNWKENTSIQVVDKKYEKEAAVLLLDERNYEFVDLNSNELGLYKTLHRIIQLNDDKGIEIFNKIYLPGGETTKLMALKARTILPGGKVINLDSSSVKEITDEDGNPQRIFAFPGLEKGCQIEYYYTYQRESSLFGLEVFQIGLPVIQSRFQISSPDRLVFEAKSFNGKSIQEEAKQDGKRSISVSTAVLEPAPDEKYSETKAQVYRVEYKLSYNKARDSAIRMFTWNELAKRVYSNYTELNDKEKKKAEELIKELKLDKLSSSADKVIALENWVKKNIQVRKDLSTEAASKIDQMLKTRLASEFGIVRLYGAILEQLNIPFQFVISGDRSNYTIDKAFENWNNADNTLIYLTETKKYFAPTRPDYRYPWIAPEWGNTLGVHCKSTSVGNIRTALADVKPIKLEDYTLSSSNLDAHVKIFPEKDSLVVDTKQSFTGYASSVYRSAFSFAPAEDQKAFLKELLKNGTNSEKVMSSKIENKEFESYSENKPFLLSASITANELMEKAGNKILLKVGEMIGGQVEMYQEKPRVFPIEIIFPHVLHRSIEIEIPDGYTAKNLESLKIDQLYPDAEQPTMFFSSSYEMTGNKLIVSIKEEYRLPEYPVDQYEPFRKIVNAAADFNKVVIVLEKKK